MTDAPVPSVNPDPKPVADSTGTQEGWVDPIHAEMASERLPDEIDTAEAEQPSAEQLAALVEANPDADAGDGKGHEAEQAASAEEVGTDTDDPDGAEEAPGEGEEPPVDGEGGKKPRRRSETRRKRRALERQVADLTTEVRVLKAGQQPAGEEAPAGEAAAAEEAEQEAPPAPKLEDYDYDTNLWSEALTEWTKNTINAGEEKQRKAEEAKQREAAEAYRLSERMNTFHGREEAARDRYEDYDDLVYDKDFLITGVPAGLIVEAENGPDIAYYLANNPDEAERVQQMSDLEAAREIGRLETRLKAEQAAAPSGSSEANTQETTEENAEEAEAAEQAPATTSPQPPLRPATQAPPVIPTVSGGAETTRDPSKMSMDEYAQGRRSGRIK